MAPVDAWNDDNWEVIADQEATVASSTANKTTEGHASLESSTSSSASNILGKPTVLLKGEEENRKLWETANSTTPFEILPSGPGKAITYKPELKILKRAPAAPAEQPKIVTQTESPVLDRKEKERRYQEARERLFGPSSSAATGDANNSASSTPTTGMSRSSSSTGIATSGTGTSGRTSKRGNTKGGSGFSTPRNRSPNRSGGVDVEKVEKPIAGTLKKTGNGWIYKADAQGNSPASRLRSPANEKADQMSYLSGGIMGMNLHGEDYAFNTSTATNGPPATVPGVWGIEKTSGFSRNSQWQQQKSSHTTQAPPQTSHATLPLSFNPQSTHQQIYYNSQLPPPQYARPNPTSMVMNPQHNYLAQQPFYQNPLYSQPQNPYAQPPGSQAQQSLYSNTGPYQTPIKTPCQSGSAGSSSLSSQTSTQSTFHLDHKTSRVVFIPDPNSFAPRPPPPTGSLNPGFNISSNANYTDVQMPIREPKGLDSRGGKGFIGRCGRGSGFTEGGAAG